MLGLINPKNLDDNECFRWCHVRKLNLQKEHPERIKLSDKESIKKLDYSGVTFPVSYKDYNKIEKQNQINVYVYGYSSFLFIQFIHQKKNMIMIWKFYILKKEGGRIPLVITS